MNPTPRRRTAFTAVVLSCAFLSTAACGSPADSASLSTQDQAWSFTDDRGRTLSLDHQPTVIVAQSSIAAALEDAGVEVAGVFGPLETEDGSVDPQASGLEIDEVTDVTSQGEYGDLDLEKLAALEPDVVISNMFVPPALWYLNEATEKKVDGLTQTLGIDFQGKTVVETIEAVAAVARELGGDDEDAAEDKAEFEAAGERLRRIGAELGDRQILAVAPTTDLLYAADPDQFPDLAYYRSLGLPIVSVEAEPASYWDELSWEKADKYAADIVLYDVRDPGGKEILEKQPAFGQLVGAREGNYEPWQAVAPPSHRAYAEVMNALADRLEAYL